MKREVPMNKQLLAAVLLCGVACGGSATSQGAASGGTAGQNAAAGTGAVAGLGATSGMGANVGFDATSGQGGTSGAGGAGSSSAGVAGSTAGAGGSNAGAAGSTAGTGGGTCSSNCGFTCCGSECVNTGNDIKNCDACGHVCPDSTPFCSAGTCDKPPCQGVTCSGTTTCCETECCNEGELCCTVSLGPVRTACFTATDKGTCPTGCAQCVCTAPNTPIATPSGDRPISELKVGDLVYSVHHGKIVAVPLILTNRVAVTGPHHMVEVRLNNDRMLSISPSHPTADGRTFADLSNGDLLDGVTIASVSRVPYTEPYTYDILPDSDSGTYFAGTVQIGTTLAGPPARNQSLDSAHAWVS